jgi:C1A family cysteine protease
MAQSRRGRYYGWVPSRPDPRDHLYSAPYECLMSLPRSVDLRADMPAVYDQGQTNSCVGNAVAAAIEYDWKRQNLTVCCPSRLFIYWEARRAEGWTDSDGGCIIRDAIKAVVRYGAPHETLWPFDVSQVLVRPSPAAYTDAQLRQAVQYSRVPQSLSQMRACLANKVPWVVGLTLFDGFESDEAMRTGIIDMPTTEELRAGPIGGHAVLAVGYDDDAQRFLVRNSWGDEWGQGGYFTLPYAYAQSYQLASDLWRITLMESTP